ncbi:hypothetical protein HK096_004306 [Nowakowskiella sp. JEL0078]|nr:hypothetical protein HK096_004306 [Nowakowskiella sp. JEL0078]
MWKVFNVKSFLDSPCGDCNWQPSIPGFENVNYTGVDIVPSAIVHNSIKYIEKTNMRFISLDLAKDGDKLPKNFDIVMCRDAIQHLPLEDGMKIFKSLEATGAKLLITNVHLPLSHPQSTLVNYNIVPGDYYPNNPLLPPFNFGTPVFYTFDTLETPFAKLMAAFELPSIEKGPGSFDLSIFNIEESKGKIIPIGSRGKELWEAYVSRLKK